jgi:hypothetical protein
VSEGLPEGWRWAALADVADVSGGLTKNSSKRGASEEIVPLVSVAAVQHRFIDVSQIGSIGVTREDGDRGQLRRGDLLVVEGNGSLAHIGRGVSDLLCKLTSGGQTSFEENVELNEHTRPSDWTLPMYLGVSDCQKKQLEDCFVVWERTTLSQRLSEL